MGQLECCRGRGKMGRRGPLQRGSYVRLRGLNTILSAKENQMRFLTEQ